MRIIFISRDKKGTGVHKIQKEIRIKVATFVKLIVPR